MLKIYRKWKIILNTELNFNENASENAFVISYIYHTNCSIGLYIKIQNLILIEIHF